VPLLCVVATAAINWNPIAQNLDYWVVRDDPRGEMKTALKLFDKGQWEEGYSHHLRGNCGTNHECMTQFDDAFREDRKTLGTMIKNRLDDYFAAHPGPSHDNEGTLVLQTTGPKWCVSVLKMGPAAPGQTAMPYVLKRTTITAPNKTDANRQGAQITKSGGGTSFTLNDGACKN
jgi:hypothetical protein